MSASDPTSLQEIHKTFIGFLRRAEKSKDETLTRTFVDSAPLMDSMSTINNQVIYGRRGTGKTHALKYLAGKVLDDNGRAIYIDLRSIGSNGAFYADTSTPTAERAIGLILDVLKSISDELYSIAIEKIDAAPHPDQLSRRLDDLTTSLTEVKLVGEHTIETRALQEQKIGKDNKYNIEASADKLSNSYNTSRSSATNNSLEEKFSHKGAEQRHIDFGRVQSSLNSLLLMLGKPRIWLLIDEWSEVPIELQPYLADLLRRTILPLDHFVIKIAAIEHRSNFRTPRSSGDYIGLELGADISADVNLDDFLVFDNDQARSVNFFKQMLFRHYIGTNPSPSINTPDELVRVAFTQAPVFAELVRASEGVPRDAINLAAKLAGKAYGKSFSIADVRAVARDWYQQDKAAIFKSWPKLDHLMTHVINTVIAQRKARAFLFPSNLKNEHIERFFDARIIHLLKRNISSKEEPGKRYDAYKIDYGCYVDLINTKNAPTGLFTATLEDGTSEVNIEVPLDDYRSIRRAVLTETDLDHFLESGEQRERISQPSEA